VRLLDAARARSRGALATTWFASIWDLVIVAGGSDLSRLSTKDRLLTGARRKTSNLCQSLGAGAMASTNQSGVGECESDRPLRAHTKSQ
jgi:hypothetical protein